MQKNYFRKITVMALLISTFTLPAAANAAGGRVKEPAATNVSGRVQEPAAADSGNIEETKLTADETKNAAAVVDSFLTAVLAKDKSYEKFITTEVTDSYIDNYYIIDKYIIANYKRKIDVRADGEALISYSGPTESIIQEMSIRKEHDGDLKINSIGEKRYVRMDSKRRQCYVNTKTVYLVSGVLNALAEDMEISSAVTFDLLKEKGLLKEPVKCPDGGDIAIKVVKSPDGQSNDVLAQCSRHGDFYELYKIDDRAGFDFDKYNKEVDAEQAILIDKLAGNVYKTFLKIQPIESAFYEASEAQNVKMMQERLASAQKIDRRLGHMYIYMIKALRKAKDEKGAKEIFDQASKIYPKWDALKKSMKEDLSKEEEHELPTE